jgi:hypothetical protein
MADSEARLVITLITLRKDERAGSFARSEEFRKGNVKTGWAKTVRERQEGTKISAYLRGTSRKDKGRMGSVGSKTLMKVINRIRKHLERKRYRSLCTDERAEVTKKSYC